MSELGEVCEWTSVTQTYHIRESGGGAPGRRRREGLKSKPLAAGRFFFEKQAILNAIEFDSARVQSHLKELNF